LAVVDAREDVQGGCCTLSSQFQEVGKRFDVTDNRVACEAKRLEGTLGSGLIACATGVGDNHRNEAQISRMARGWLNPNLSCRPEAACF